MTRVALTALSLCLLAGCGGAEEERQNGPSTALDASVEPSWTRCPASEAGANESLHESALAALVPASPSEPGPCAFGGCHNERAAKAEITLSAGSVDLRALLVGVPACEVPSLAVVDGRGGDDALTRSWLWQKLTAPAAMDGSLLAQASWGQASSCATQAAVAAPYGARMPQGIGPGLLSDDRLRALQRWICAGAPAAPRAP